MLPRDLNGMLRALWMFKEMEWSGREDEDERGIFDKEGNLGNTYTFCWVGRQDELQNS